MSLSTANCNLLVKFRSEMKKVIKVRLESCQYKIYTEEYIYILNCIAI